MARLRILQWGLALILLVLIEPNFGFKDDACSTTCSGSQRLPSFRYLEGTTYKYNFESAIQISLSSSKSQHSRTGIKGIALVTPLSPCTHLLRLQNVEVVSGNFQRYTGITGIDRPIQFKINDGVVNDHICVEPEDMHNSLNIKRAVASLFQIDTRYEHQTDVFGFCPTVSSTTTEGGDVVVTKTKDLDECDFRESIREDFMVSSFNPYSEVKTSPIMSGEYLSKQRIKNGILDKVYVFENYTYLAFTDIEEDKDNLGAQAKVATKLEFVSTSRDYAQSRVSESKSIIFDNPHPIMSDRSNIDSILSAVRKLSETDGMAIKEHTARDFLDLVKILRDSNKDDMLTAFRQVKAGAGLRDRVTARRVFLDALFKCGTGNAIVVGVELLKNRELDRAEEVLVYLSFAFVKHATLSALEAASSLLDTQRLPREAYLGIGNLAGRYCREHQCNVDAVNRLTQRLTGKLGYGKAYARDEENEIIFALKALANIHHLDEQVLTRVTNIVQDKQSPVRLRVAAIDTYMSDPCHESVRNGAIRVLKDTQEDSELRIKAYLVLAKCPDRRVAQVIKDMLDTEPSYQVGGYIVSHLRYLSSSANPDKKKAAHFLGNINTNKKFPIDPRKYSFNTELSYDLGLWGVSSSAEADVIYSQNSFLPRSTNLNLTAEIFGHTINFLEVGTRQQNLDRLLEHYFGPLGVFNKATPDELKKSGQHTLNKIAEHFNRRLQRSRLRGKRDVSKAAIENFGREVQIRTNELNNELDLDLSIKLFGSELFFLSISDDAENLSPEDIIDRFFDEYEKELAEYQRFDHNFHTNSLFLDSEFSYPTSLGFPLRLGIEGTASVQVKTKGNIDVAALLDESPNGGVFKLSVIPSADIEVAASITLDAQVFESGLKVVSNLHTATGGDLEVNLQDRNRGMEVKFSLPLQKQKIISATHEVVLNSRELGKPENIEPIRIGQNKDINLCLNDMSPFIGLNFCMDLSSPSTATEKNPVLAGNYKFDMIVNNEDFSHFHYKEELFNDYRKTGAQMTAEVIGSRQNKKLSLVVEAFSLPDMYVKASVTSPMTTASVEGRITINEHEQSISYELKQDRDRYYGKLGITASGPPNRRRFTPILQYIVPGSYGQQRTPINVHGSFVVEQTGPRDIRFTFEDLKLYVEDAGAHGRPATLGITGNVGHGGHDYYSDITLTDGITNILINGRLHFQKNVVKLDGQVKNSRDPKTNIHVIYKFKRSPTEIDSSLQLVHGPDPNSQHNRLTIIDSLIYKRINDYDYEVRTKNKITYPAENFAVAVDYAATPNSLFYDVEAQYKSFIIGSEMNLKYSQRVEGDYELDFQIYDENDEVELKAKREIQGDVNRIDNVLVVNGEKYEVGGTVTLYERERSELTADLLVRLPHVHEPLKVYESLKSSPHEFNNVFKVTGNYEQYVDSTLTITDDNTNGNLRVAVRNSFTLNAFVKESRGIGNAELTFDTIDHLLKSEMSYTTVNPYNIRFTLYPDFNRNRGDYLTITSNNDLKENSLDTKNTIDMSGSKTVINGVFYGKGDDDDNDKSLSMAIDFTVPDGDFGSIKYNYKHEDSLDGTTRDQSLVVEARGLFDWRSAKLSAQEILKENDLEEGQFDYTYLLFADDGEGGVAHIDLYGKHSPSDEEPVTEEYKIKIYGHRENEGLEAKATAVYKEFDGSYNFLVTSDQGRYLFDVNGKYDMNSLFTADSTSPLTEKITIEIKTPKGDLQHLKIDAEAAVAETNFPEGYVDVKGSVGFLLNDNQWSRRDTSINVKADGELKLGVNDATVRLTVHSQNTDPVTVTAKYTYEGGEGKQEKYTSNVAINYERYKNIKSDVALVWQNEHEIQADLNLESTQSPPTRIHINAKESPEQDYYHCHATITTNNNRYEFIEELDLREVSPGFKVQLIYPNQRTDQIALKTKIPNNKSFQGELKVQSYEHNFDFDGKVDANLVSEEDFSIKVTANCPYLEIYNFIADIQNKPLGYSAPENIISTSKPLIETAPRFSDYSQTYNGYQDYGHTNSRYTTHSQRYDPYHYNQEHTTQNQRYDPYSYYNREHTTPTERYDPYSYYSQEYTTQSQRRDSHTYYNREHTTERQRYDPYSYYNQEHTTPSQRRDSHSYYNQEHTTERQRYDPYSYYNQERTTQSQRNDPYRYYNQEHTTQRQRYDDPRTAQYYQVHDTHSSNDPYRYYDQSYQNQNQYSSYEDPRYTTTSTTTPKPGFFSSWFSRKRRDADQTYGYGQSGYMNPPSATRHRDRYRDPNYDAFSYGERLQVSVQHAGRNIISGSASYLIRDEGDKLTVEGAGTFVYKTEPARQHTYKVVQQKVHAGRESGEGIEYTWNFSADRDVIEGKLKMTDRELAFFTNSCESNSRCHLRIQADSKIYYINANNFEIDQNAVFDFGYWQWNEIGFKNRISNRGDVFDAVGEVYADSQSRKYQYKLYGSDKNFEASLTTPQRVISLEGKVQTPWQGRSGPSSFNIDFYLNKNHQPHQKTSLNGLVDCQEGRQEGRCNLEMKFSNPALQKDLGITYTALYDVSKMNLEYNLVFDVFTNANNKLIITAKANAQTIGREGASANTLFEIKSQGLNVDLKYEDKFFFEPTYARELKYTLLTKYHIGRANYDNVLTVEANPRQALFLIKLLNKEIINVDAKINSRGDYGTATANVRALGVRPSTVNLDVTETSLKCTISRMDNPSERFEITLSALTNNAFDYNIRYYERGLPMHLVTAFIRVNDKNELETLYQYDKENVRRLIIEPSKNEYRAFKRELEYLKENAERELSTQMQQVEEISKWNTPDFRPLEQYYRTELQKFQQELTHDPTLRKIVDFLTNYLQPILDWVGQMLIRIEELNRSSEEAMRVQYQKLLEMYEREYLPWLNEYYDKASKTGADVWKSVEDLIDTIIDEIFEYLDKHEKEIKAFANFVLDNLEDLIVFSIKLARELEKELTEELNKLYKEIKATIVFDELEAKLKEAMEGRPVPESYIRNFREAVTTLQESVHNPVVRKFITALTDYIEQKLRRQPVDDVAAIQNILIAGYEVLDEAYDTLVGESDDDFEISWEALYAIPKLIEAEISPLTYLLYGDWPDLEELLDSISFDADDWSLPEDFDAVIAQGQHIFTFDGNHFTFPGSCNYLLARDAVNGNFSIVGSYANGQLTSITFSDMYDTVTIRKGGHLLINQAPIEYPVRKQHRLEVYRDYESITIWSKAGVKIVCGPELLVCGFHISGYYHAQLRGLLGNGNNEPYDDYTLPTGLIVTNVGEFGNSFKIEKHCTDARASSARVQRHPACSRLFGENSPLRMCRYFVDPKNYRTACDHGMAAGIKNTELAIATAYVASCRTKDIYIDVPENFAKCENYEKPTRVDDQFRVVTPGRTADIVLVVDQDKINEVVFRDLIRPLTTQLVTALSAEGISDVDFHLIGFGGEYEKQPAHYTVNGKLSFKAGQVPNIQFSTPLKEGDRETFMEYLERIAEEIELLTGQDMVGEAYIAATNIPFRAQAVKSIIVLNSKPCDEAGLEPLHDLASWFLSDAQISVHLFTPVKGINPRDHIATNIVGFDKNNVFSFSSPEGSKAEPPFEHDNICIDFALQNRGNVFVTNNFIHGRSKSQYIQVAARNIAKKLTNVEQWLDCKCKMISAYSAQNECTVSYSRKRETASRGRLTHGRHYK